MIPPPTDEDRAIDLDDEYVAAVAAERALIPSLIRLLAESRIECETLRGKIAELADEPDVDPVTRLWATGFRVK